MAIVLVSDPSDVTIRIYDVTGNIRHARKIQGLNNYSESFDLSDVPNGVYSIVLQEGLENRVFHFIVSR